MKKKILVVYGRTIQLRIKQQTVVTLLEEKVKLSLKVYEDVSYIYINTDTVKVRVYKLL